jgi:hypothetical protein
MSIMTRLPGVPDRDDVKPGMAHFAGSGPYGATCGTCLHRGYWRAGKEKFNKRTGLIEERRIRSQGCKIYMKLAMQYGPPVDKRWAACKYYEENPAK